MNSFPQLRASRAGRTMVKIVIVVALVAILLGLLFPAVSVPGPHRKTQAKTDCVQIVAAIKAYYSEYGHYPLGANVFPEGATPTTFIYGQAPTAPGVGSGVSNAQLFDILRNVDSTGKTPPDQPNQYNPRGIVFFDAKTATDEIHPRSGFVPPNSKPPLHPGALLDPWGTEFFIAIGSGPEMPLTILPYKDFQNESAPKVDVGVFSLGKDQRLGAKGDGYFQKSGSAEHSDDIISWQ